MWLRADLTNQDWKLPEFKWFFHDADRLGQLFHQPQVSDDVYKYIIDYESFKLNVDMVEAKASAKKLIERAKLPCFSKTLPRE